MAQVKVPQRGPVTAHVTFEVTVLAREQAMVTGWDYNRSSLEDPNTRLDNNHKSHQMVVEACYKHCCQSTHNYPDDP